MGFSRACLSTVAFVVTSIVVQSVCEFVVVRHPLTENANTRDLTCIYEGENSALVWNYNYKSDEYANFQPEIPKDTNCALYDSSTCNATWENKSGWNVVESVNHPIGPVHDYRWEGFKEFLFEKSIEEEKYQHVRELNGSSGTVILSARGRQDIFIILCENEDQTNDRCFSVIIGSSNGKTSEIWSCYQGAPTSPRLDANEGCHNIKSVTHKTAIIDLYEWRTFRIKWDMGRKTIQVFNDNEYRPFLTGNIEEWHPTSHMLVKSGTSSRVRFHFYEYLLTEKKDAELSTTRFIQWTDYYCVELLVGLCHECELKIDLVDRNGQNITSKDVTRDTEDLPSAPLYWRSVTMEASFQGTFPRIVRFKIKPILRTDASKGQWAIDNFRTCQSYRTLRKSTITINRETTGKTLSWPQVTCQKISHYKSAIVYTLPTNMNSDKTYRLQQWLRGFIETYESSHPNSIGNWSWCDSSGCTCDPGFRGEKCDKRCSSGYYGYKCSETCESCRTRSCDVVNGYCSTGCANNRRLLPPLCQKELKLENPIIVDITDSTARVLQNLEHPSEIGVTMKTKLQTKGFLWYSTAIYPARSTGSTMYETNITGLKEKTEYTIQMVGTVTVAGEVVEVTGPKSDFTTKSSGEVAAEHCFHVVPQSRTLTVNFNEDADVCNRLHQEYGTFLVKIDERADISWNNFPSNIIHHLSPATNYAVCISGNEGVLWTSTVRTLESAPEKVANLRYSYTSDIEVTLKWDVPLKRNGIIRKYKVTIQGSTYYGCMGLRRTSHPEREISREVNDTAAYFSDLHPYAKYTAIVIAYTSEPGPEQSVEFETQAAAIPTSVVSKLELVKDQTRLEWDDPEDCDTISGPVRTKRILFARASQAGPNWEKTVDSNTNHLDLINLSLTAYTSYRVRVYIVGKTGIVNETLYQEKLWTTPPSAPPAVGNLKIFDADPEENSIQLRWQPPDPPHGEIEFYSVMITKESKILKNLTIEASKGIPMCEFAENYVCAEILNLPADVAAYVQIQIFAKNKNVDETGKRFDLPFALGEYYNQAPDAPQNLTAIDQSHGIVMLTWTHPPYSPTKITRFRIDVAILYTDLLEKPGTESEFTIDYSVAQRRKKYNYTLCLSTSTRYRFTVVAVNRRHNDSSEIESEYFVPQSIGFTSEKELKVQFDGTWMKIDVPKIVNATRNSTLTVIVGGPSTCTPRSSAVDVKEPVTEWDAAVYQIGKNETESLTIQAKEHQGVASKCSLDPKGTYTIVFEVKASNSSLLGTFKLPLNSQKQNLAWIIIIPMIIVICLLLFFVFHRKYRKAPLKTSQQDILQLDPMMAIQDSTAPSTLKRGTLPPDTTHTTMNQESIRPTSPDVIPSNNPNSCPVNVENFEEYTRKALAKNLLDSQYEMFQKSIMKPCEYASIPENLPKNRYKDRIPYDETRVVLNEIPEEPHSDYINASYIQGYRKKKAYIATQGPKPKTVKDFWRMVWQEKTQVICMLANVTEGGKRKCEQYWPEVGTNIKYGGILISNTRNLVFADYTFRTFTLRYRKEAPREVTHLHFTGWPDHGVPMYTQSLVAYLKKLLATSSGTGPVVVHCSAGVGRTGTIILCDICLRQAAVERIIDVPAVILRMREDRPNMVDNAQQYLLAHLAIVESMIVEQTQIRCDIFFATKIIDLRKQLPSDVQRLKGTVWQDRALHSLGTPEHLTRTALATNRISKLVSVSPVMGRSEQSVVAVIENNRIDGVNVDGARMKNQYIAARVPSASTLSDFWKLVGDKNIELIVMLQQPESKDRTCCNIVPGESVLVPSPNIQVERKTSLEKREHFTIDKLLLTDISTETELRHPVTVLTCTGWGRGKRGKPPTPAVLVSLWIASEKISRQEGQTLILCQDGVTACGLYLALSFLLERIAVEGECDVISAVRAIRRSKTEFVQSLDQFECLYDAAVNYVKCFEIYANFS